MSVEVGEALVHETALRDPARLVDDEFVADATEFETVDDYRTDVETRIANMKKAQASMALASLSRANSSPSYRAPWASVL